MCMSNVFLGGSSKFHVLPILRPDPPTHTQIAFFYADWRGVGVRLEQRKEAELGRFKLKLGTKRKEWAWVDKVF